MRPVEPIDTVALFPLLSAELLAALRGLERSDWHRPTACAGWSVKDVAAHLLGGSLARLRDETDNGPLADLPAIGYAELVAVIDRSNAQWVQAARRIRPSLLIQFLEITDALLYEQFKAIPLMSLARIGVAWAGEERSLAWFDIAREYTEKWLHQQHIREAAGKPVLDSRDFLFPVMDTFLRGLPHTYRQVQAAEGVMVEIDIEGPAGGVWSLRREGPAWRLYAGSGEAPQAVVRIPQQVAWRLFTRGMLADIAREHVQLLGDEALATQALDMVSIMA